MKHSNLTFPATIIISVYKDTRNLECILDALSIQTVKPAEIIISEDGDSPQMNKFVSAIKEQWPQLVHLTQEDKGFRKNRALNRAINQAQNDLLIFIDGDCMPHKEFIRAHTDNCQPGSVAIGRRAEIGPIFSSICKNSHFFRRLIQYKLFYIPMILPLSLDKGKNIESGIFSRFLHNKNIHKKAGLLGCNFSIYKQDIEKINGFNEDYIYPGIGEDSDIEWRLSQSNIKGVNIKFLAIEYHLYHQSKYIPSHINMDIFEQTRENNLVFCKNGINKSN